jgi:hypothetical protein
MKDNSNTTSQTEKEHGISSMEIKSKEIINKKSFQMKMKYLL